MATKKLYRKVFVDCIENIDFQNVGCHTSKNKNVAVEFSDVMGKKSQNSFLLEIFIDDAFVAKEATNASNRDYPKEKECVLYPNSEIKKIDIWEIRSGKYGGLYFVETKKSKDVELSTGTRFDIWITELYIGENY